MRSSTRGRHMRFNHLKRREFITLLGGAAVTWPLPLRAQQADRVRRIGVLFPYVKDDSEGQLRRAVFQEGLQQLGWTEGRNIGIEYRWFAGEPARAQVMAKELVELQPDLIVAGSAPALAAVAQWTRTIPVVFVQVSDPVGSGFVAGLARPGGNITGFTNFESEMSGKWLGLLKEAAPNLTRVAMPFHPETANNVAFLRAAEAVAPSLGVQVTAARVHDGIEIERAIAAFAREPDGGLLITPHPILVTNRGSIIELAARYHLPAIYPFGYIATEGGLIAYGPDQIDQWRGAARYTDRILKGEKPGELPVQAPTKFELVINLQAAKAIGHEVPAGLVLRADKLIE
jgi:putative tryptophan/tyrosine transport system substrate-binding protein